MLALPGVKTTFRSGDCDNLIMLLPFLFLVTTTNIAKHYPSYI